MKRAAWVLLPLMLTVDVLTKQWASSALKNMPLGTQPLWPGVLHFTYAENRGIAFSLLPGHPVLMAFFQLLALVGVLVLCARFLPKGGWLTAAQALVVAGGLGNLIDRVRLGFVVDFIDLAFLRFAVFNVADICITGGAVLLGALLVFSPKEIRHGNP